MRSCLVHVGIAALCSAVLSGCAAADEAAQVPRAVTDHLRVGLTEWSIETGPVELEPGDVRVLVMNTGAAPHDLVVGGEHGSWRTPVLHPGERFDLTVHAVPGEVLDLDCSLTGHHTQGMHTRIPVRGQAP